MGDLWPRSLLYTGSGWYLIDWELAHFGSPAQDLGHWAAHTWMLEHRSAAGLPRSAARRLWTDFLEGYLSCLPTSGPLITQQTCHDAAVHAAAEILARTTGAFRTGYLYDSLSPTSPEVREAVHTAVHWIRNPFTAERFRQLQNIA
jgi:hypothetical protein